MLEKFSKILYIFLSSLFVLSIIIYISKWWIYLDTKIFYILFILILPFIELFIESTKKSFTFANLWLRYKDNVYKYIWLVLLSIGLYFYNIDIEYIWITIFLIFSLLFKIDSRISFVLALLLLIITPLYLIIWDKEIAERVSIFAYYMLIIWVILEIKNQVFQNKDNIKESSEEIVKVNSENELTFMDEILAFVWTQIQWLKSKVLKTKNNILEEIWEWKGNKKEIQKKVISQKVSPAQHAKVLLKATKQNFYVKLFNYFLKKIKENVLSTTLLLFCLSTISTLLLLWYDFFEMVTIYLFTLLILSYLYSKNLWAKYDLRIAKIHSIKSISKKKFLTKEVTIEDAVLNSENISQEELDNISVARSQENVTITRKRNRFFINKAIIFASFWLVIWYFLIEYFKINTQGAGIYIGTFALFFLAYYFTFSDLDSRLWTRSKRTGKYMWTSLENFSIKDFFMKHIYMLLNIILILSILAVLWFKTWIFAEWYKMYQEKVGYENWVLTPEAILKNEVDEKKRLWELLKPKIDIYSQEAKIKEENQIEIQTEIKNISDIYKFTQTLSEWTINDEVEILEWFMSKLGYFDKEADTTFDTDTKDALTNLLKTECGWPDTTRWIFGNLATQCLYTLEVETEVTWTPEVTWENIISQPDIISNEAQINDVIPTEIAQPETVEIVQKIPVAQYHTFTQSLSLGSKNDEVTRLEEIMIKLNYFDADADNLFEEKTKDALTNLLKTECDWPETTKWILWNQAMQCLYSLEIEADR